MPSKLDPDGLALRAPPRPVVRLNRRVLAAGTGVLALGVLGLTVVSLQPMHRSADTAGERRNVERVTRSEALDRLPKNYAELPASRASAPVLGPPLPGDLGSAMVQMGSPSRPSMGEGVDEASERMAQRRALDEALRSPVFFKAGLRATGGAPATPSAAAPVDTVLSGTGPATGVAPSSDPTAVQNRQEQKLAFAGRGEGTAASSGDGLQPPVSPYALTAGTVIAAALITGIDSDLPGQVIAGVTEPVYDSATGRHLLIPQGARLIGRYDSQVAFGQRRVLLVWTRLVLPDASSLALDRLPGVDAAGHAGLEDGVDWHGDWLLAGAALSTVLGVGAELAAPGDRSDGSRVVIAARESVQDTVNQVGQELTRRTMSVQPTLKVRPGFPVRVLVSRDLVLRPYQPLFFERG